jgi:hypothetical protein
MQDPASTTRLSALIRTPWNPSREASDSKVRTQLLVRMMSLKVYSPAPKVMLVETRVCGSSAFGIPSPSRSSVANAVRGLAARTKTKTTERISPMATSTAANLSVLIIYLQTDMLIATLDAARRVAMPFIKIDFIMIPSNVEKHHSQADAGSARKR